MDLIKQNPTIFCLQERHCRSKDIHMLNMKEWKKTVHANGNQKGAGVAIPISKKNRFLSQKLLQESKREIIMIRSVSSPGRSNN